MAPRPKSGWTRSAKALDQVHCVSAEVLEWHRALDQVHGVSGTGIVIIVKHRSMDPKLRIVRGQRAAAKEVRGEDAVGLHHGDGGEHFLVGEDELGR